MPTEDGSGLRSSVLLCPHGCGPWGLCEALRPACVKANKQTLSSTLLASLTLCFLCSFLLTGHPNMGTCILQQTTFAAVLTVAVSTVLAKTITVVLALNTTAPGERMRHWLIPEIPNSVIPSVPWSKSLSVVGNLSPFHWNEHTL